MRFLTIIGKLYFVALDFGDLVPERDPYHPPSKDKKHGRFNPALKHSNKHRYVRSRKLSRGYR